jgi:hypothetical protein
LDFSQAQRNFAVDLLEKFQPLAVAVFLGGVSDDFALQIIQRGKEGNRSVAVIIVGLGADMPLTRWQARLAALKSLNLAFLVTTKHHCLLGRIEVKTDDIQELGFKVRIGGKLKDPCQVGFDFVLTPDPLHGRLGNSQFSGHGAVPRLCPTSRDHTRRELQNIPPDRLPQRRSRFQCRAARATASRPRNFVRGNKRHAYFKTVAQATSVDEGHEIVNSRSSLVRPIVAEILLRLTLKSRVRGGGRNRNGTAFE